MMNKFYWLAILAAVGWCGCGKKPEKPPGENPITAPVDYLGAVAKGKTAAERTIDLAALKQAIQMFQVEEGRWPRDLNELVTAKLIPQIPTPPPGMKLVYDPATGEVKMVRQ